MTRLEYETALERMRALGFGAVEDGIALPVDRAPYRYGSLEVTVPADVAPVVAERAARVACEIDAYLTLSPSGREAAIRLAVSRPLEPGE